MSQPKYVAVGGKTCAQVGGYPVPNFSSVPSWLTYVGFCKSDPNDTFPSYTAASPAQRAVAVYPNANPGLLATVDVFSLNDEIYGQSLLHDGSYASTGGWTAPGPVPGAPSILNFGGIATYLNANPSILPTIDMFTVGQNHLVIAQTLRHDGMYASTGGWSGAGPIPGNLLVNSVGVVVYPIPPAPPGQSQPSLPNLDLFAVAEDNRLYGRSLLRDGSNASTGGWSNWGAIPFGINFDSIGGIAQLPSVIYPNLLPTVVIYAVGLDHKPYVQILYHDQRGWQPPTAFPNALSVDSIGGLVVYPRQELVNTNRISDDNQSLIYYSYWKPTGDNSIDLFAIGHDDHQVYAIDVGGSYDDGFHYDPSRPPTWQSLGDGGFEAATILGAAAYPSLDPAYLATVDLLVESTDGRIFAKTLLRNGSYASTGGWTPWHQVSVVPGPHPTMTPTPTPTPTVAVQPTPTSTPTVPPTPTSVGSSSSFTVAIISPASGTVLSPVGLAIFNVDVSIPASQIASVRYEANGGAQTTTTPPFEYLFFADHHLPGTYELTATVTAVNGNTGTSAPVTVIVNGASASPTPSPAAPTPTPTSTPKPILPTPTSTPIAIPSTPTPTPAGSTSPLTITITSPASGTSLAADGEAIFNVDVSIPASQIANVTYNDNGVPFLTDKIPSYQCLFYANQHSSGTHVITATMTDVHGNQVTSAPVTVIVEP